jgi:LPS-assembly protein
VNPFLALFAGALLAQPGEPAPGSGPASAAPQAPVQVEAATIVYDAASDRYELGGGVTLRRGEVTVRARTARYDAKTGEVDAAGNVLLLEPGRVVAADGLHAIVDGPYEAREVVAFFKDRPLDLSAVRTLDEGRRTGSNRMTLCGERVRGEVEGERFEVDSALITMCDCGGSAPSWEIKAHHADVISGQRAILTWPVIYITPRFLFIQKPVPVLALPWLYVPLSDRQTGLLFPEVSNTARAGWAVSQPLFVTLGRSWDATVTAGYAFGIGEDALRAGTRGIQGPGAGLELRWAPAEGVAGQLRVTDLHDTARSYVGSEASPPHGERLSLTLRHDQRLSDASFLSVETALVNDANYLQDFTGDVLLRRAEYGRSSVALTHRASDWLLEADAAYLLPLQNLGQQDFSVDPGTGLPRVPFGLFGGDVPVFHRLPSVSATLLPVRIAGPVMLSGAAGAARFAPIQGATGDEGVNGIGAGDRGFPFYYFPPWYQLQNPAQPTLRQTQGAAGQDDGRWESGERLAATRLAAQMELRAPLALGRYLAVEPWARVSALAYAFQAAAEPQLDGRIVGGVTLSTQVSRTFGDGTSRVRHVVEPRLEWAWGGFEQGPALPAYAYDELDAPRAFPTAAIDPATGLPLRPLSAMPPGGFQQLRLAVRNRLVAPAGTLSRGMIDLELGQDFDLMAGRRSETWARTGFGFGPLSGGLLARFYAFGANPPPGTQPTVYPSGLDSFTELRADVRLGDARGDDVHGSLFAVGAGASPQTKAGIDALFDPRPIAFDALAQGQLGAHARISGMQASYDALFNARSLYGPRCDGTVGEIAPHVQQHVVALVWNSPCNCWKLGLTLAFRECQGGRPDFQFVFDLSQLTAGRF